MTACVPLYFGCWSSTARGHYLYTVDGKTIWRDATGPASTLPEGWSCPDATLTPSEKCGACYPCNNGLDHCRRPRPQVQGAARVHHAGGWTALSLWDRTGDPRHGSNSTFLLPGTLDFARACAAARAAFPMQWERILGAGPVTPG